jgi:hypothetical protein
MDDAPSVEDASSYVYIFISKSTKSCLKSYFCVLYVYLCTSHVLAESHISLSFEYALLAYRDENIDLSSLTQPVPTI